VQTGPDRLSHFGEQSPQYEHILLHAVPGLRNAERGRRVVGHQAQPPIVFDGLPVEVPQASLFTKKLNGRHLAKQDDDLGVHERDLPIQPVLLTGIQFECARRSIARRRSGQLDVRKDDWKRPQLRERMTHGKRAEPD
jgi:hypothetical protein